MIRQKFYIPEYSWAVWVYYNTGELDAEEILGALRYIGVSEFEYTVAYDNLTADTLNSGLCYSNLGKRKTILVISNTTTPQQFMNSFIHEIRHLERHIEQAYDIDPYSEEAAYLAGHIGELMFPKAKIFMCKCYQKFSNK